MSDAQRPDSPTVLLCSFTYSDTMLLGYNFSNYLWKSCADIARCSNVAQHFLELVICFWFSYLIQKNNGFETVNLTITNSIQVLIFYKHKNINCTEFRGKGFSRKVSSGCPCKISSIVLKAACFTKSEDLPQGQA